MTRVRELALTAAVALAFADSSIVVLALPDLLGRFDASVLQVSWVVTSYNAVLAVVPAGLALAGRRLDPRRLVRLGLALFAAASVGCAAANGLWVLVGLRSVQGLGGALLLSGALPLLGARGAARWALAGAIGTAIGPAAGGALTELFDWRAIFVAQAPVAVLALVAIPTGVFRPAAHQRSRIRGLGANAALALVSGALVGALFLSVVLLVDGWRLSPLAAAAVVSALPVASVAARRLARAGGAVVVAGAGALLLATGLAGLALLPADEIAWFVACLVFCGLGLGLAVPGLTSVSLACTRPDAAGAWSTAVRHAGLVVALVLLTPLLARDLTAGVERAKLVGSGLVLDAPLPTSTKVPLAVDLARALQRVPKGKVPDFSPQFAPYRSASGIAGLQRSLERTTRAIVTRTFRGAFGLAALLALVAVAPLLLLRRGPA